MLAFSHAWPRHTFFKGESASNQDAKSGDAHSSAHMPQGVSTANSDFEAELEAAFS
jgi:hypothetical protein